jgi:hypothetical protein
VDEDPIARLSEGFDREIKAGDDSWDRHQGFGCYLPPVEVLEPGSDDLDEIGRRSVVAEKAVIDACVECFEDRFWGFEIHVGDEHWQDFV